MRKIKSKYVGFVEPTTKKNAIKVNRQKSKCDKVNGKKNKGNKVNASK